ncbi:FadR/GntR family transcriptional regulator [Jatrophihabitans fulvus]
MTRPRRIPKLAEVVAAELRGRILSGELEPGESLLSEATLMEEYDVSRPTLREALRLLESQNLVTVRRGSHRGPIVSHPSSDVPARAVAIQLQLRRATLDDVYEFRMIYEPTAARWAAEKAGPDGVAELREVLVAEEAALGDTAAFAEAAWRFHSVLAKLSGNATMAIVTESLQHISAQHAARSMSRTPDRREWQQESLKVHRRLVDLIEKGDGAAAARFWTKHMNAVAEIQDQWSSGVLVTELSDT